MSWAGDAMDRVSGIMCQALVLLDDGELCVLAYHPGYRDTVSFVNTWIYNLCAGCPYFDFMEYPDPERNYIQPCLSTGI